MVRPLSCLFTLSLIPLLSCNRGHDDDSDSAPDGWSLTLSESGTVEISHDGRSLFTLTGMETQTFTPEVSSVFGVFSFNKTNPATNSVQLVQDRAEIRLESGGVPIGSLSQEETPNGMPTVVTAGLTIGLSGIGYFSHDIAGFSGGPREKELFLRWTEIGAFTPIMRTHDGLQKTANHHFDGDAETLAHFTRFSKIHQALLPYFAPLAQETKQTGLPMIRHTVLVDPEWDGALEAHHQWMLGNDLLFVPVVSENTDSVEARFPEGEWTQLFTGESYPGRTIAQVNAPLGRPAVFYLASNTTLEEIAQKIKRGIQ